MIHLILETINVFGVSYCEIRAATLSPTHASEILAALDDTPPEYGIRASLSIHVLTPGVTYDGTASIPLLDPEAAEQRTPPRPDPAPPDRGLDRADSREGDRSTALDIRRPSPLARVAIPFVVAAEAGIREDERQHGGS
jgi:hypothetical protein